MPNYTLTLNEQQAEILSRALDFYARIGRRGGDPSHAGAEPGE